MSSQPPAMMACVEITAPGGPETLRASQRPPPIPGAGEALIAVEAAGVNRPDILQRQGHYDPPPGASDLPGLEVAGRIAALGPGAGEGKWAVGDPVCALTSGGGYAGFCAVPTPQVLAVPPGLSMVEAAALPETLFTVWTNVFERGALKAGETLLVHGGASGIGTIAIQLAKAFGAQVLTTVGRPEKIAPCLALGADRVIDHTREDFVEAVLEATGGRGCDVVLDMVGGDYVARNLKALAPDGRHVSIAFLQGAKVTINLMSVMAKRLSLTGSTLRARSVAEKGRIAEALTERVWPLIAAGRVKPVIFATFKLAEAAQAHRLMETSAHIGKIVLTL